MLILFSCSTMLTFPLSHARMWVSWSQRIQYCKANVEVLYVYAMNVPSVAAFWWKHAIYRSRRWLIGATRV